MKTPSYSASFAIAFRDLVSGKSMASASRPRSASFTMRAGICGAGLWLLVTGAGAQSQSAKVQQMADLVVSAYNERDYDAIVRQFNSVARARVTAEELRRAYDRLHASAGNITSLGKPAFFDDAIGIFPATFEHAAKELIIALDDAGRIRGLEINDRKTQTSRNRTKLLLPFKGDWIVEWGGDTPEENYHQSIALVRFAFDFLKVDDNGKTFRNDGKKSTDYYGFGEDILAPADGTVTDVITGVRDNVPGVVNNFADIGNMVMIRHAEGEVSVFAHLKLGSTRVAVGQRVTRGQVIGLIGNSGNSDEPHLHYQLQDTEVPTPESTIKVFFERVTVRRDGRTVIKGDYSPVRGDIVRQE